MAWTSCLTPYGELLAVARPDVCIRVIQAKPEGAINRNGLCIASICAWYKKGPH
jgi:hypothetical protein